MRKRFYSFILVLCLLLTSLPIYADVSVEMIEQDINTDGSYQSNQWFTIFSKVLPSKAANGARFYLVLDSLKAAALQGQITTVLDSDSTRKARLAAYGLTDTKIHSIMMYYMNTFPANMAEVEYLSSSPKTNLYADLYHDNDVKYSNYMVDFYVYLNQLFDQLPTQVKEPIRIWDVKGQGEIILYQSLMNIIIRTKLGIERYYDGSLQSRDLGLLSVTEAMIADDLTNYASAISPLTSAEELAIAEYSKMFVDFGNVILESCELNLKTSGQTDNFFTLGKLIEVIMTQTRFPKDDPDPDPDPITINVNPDGQTIFSAPANPGEQSQQDFNEFLTGFNGPVDWTVDRPDIVQIDENGLVSLSPNFPDQPEESYIVRVRATIRGRSEFAEVILFVDSPEALGFADFYGSYISGYENGTFRELNNITRAEAATMFSRVLQFDVKEYKKDENGAFELTETNNRIPIYYAKSDYESPSYNDVNQENWAYVYIELSKENDLFKGIVNGKFEPNTPMTRAEIAVVVANAWDALDIKKDPIAKHYIKDVTSKHWAFDAINRVYNYGIVDGFEDNTFRPDESITRVQIVTMINAIINRKAALTNVATFSDIPTGHLQFGAIEAATREQIKLNTNLQE